MRCCRCVRVSVLCLSTHPTPPNKPTAPQHHAATTTTLSFCSLRLHHRHRRLQFKTIMELLMGRPASRICVRSSALSRDVKLDVGERRDASSMSRDGKVSVSDRQDDFAARAWRDIEGIAPPLTHHIFATIIIAVITTIAIVTISTSIITMRVLIIAYLQYRKIQKTWAGYTHR